MRVDDVRLRCAADAAASFPLRRAARRLPRSPYTDEMRVKLLRQIDGMLRLMASRGRLDAVPPLGDYLEASF